MTIMEFGKMPDDAGEPVGLVVRKKADGSYKFILSDGEDEDLNDLLAGLEIEVKEEANDIKKIRAEQDAKFQKKGKDMEALIRAKRGERPDREPRV